MASDKLTRYRCFTVIYIRSIRCTQSLLKDKTASATVRSLDESAVFHGQGKVHGKSNLILCNLLLLQLYHTHESCPALLASVSAGDPCVAQ